MTLAYASGAAWRDAPSKRVCLFGMSGVGKTRVAALLRATGEWFHYSVDYRIGTRWLGEAIADEFKREAMKNPRLARLLRSDSIYVGSNITFDNLAPLSDWLGVPGDPSRGGLDWEEWQRRQGLHREAEIGAMLEADRFADRAKDIYGYPHFVCDTSGSICEVVDPDDPCDPVLAALAAKHLLVWIEGDRRHADMLSERFARAPKPMYYRPEVVAPIWARDGGDGVDPAEFARVAYGAAIGHRHPRYAAIARRGVTVTAEEVAAVADAAAFDDVVARAIDRRGED